MDARRKQKDNKVLVLNKASYSNYRNLGKSQLGGVIFGCKTASMNECLNNQLFGLPANHISYVKNIDVGLPLFLFNYSTRRLHGIFEAASPGKLNINPYAWSDYGAKTSSYPAQVQIRVRLQCQSLDEEQFKPIILGNYYNSKHFWFELDHAQTDRLISLLSSVVIAPSTFAPQLSKERKIPLTLQRRGLGNEGFDTAVSDVDFARSSNSKRSPDDLDVDGNQSFETSSDRRTRMETEKDLIYMKLKEMALNRKRLDPSSSVDNYVVMDGENMEHEGLLKKQIKSEEKLEITSATSTNDHSGIAELKNKVEEFNTFKTEQSQKMGYLQQKLVEAEAEIKWLKERCMILESRSNSYVAIGNETASGTFTELNPDIDAFMYLIGGYDGTQSLSALDAYSPLLDTVKSLQPMNSARSYAAVASLNGEIYIFGGGSGALCFNTVEAYQPANNTWNSRPSLNRVMGSLAGATVNNKLFALGGGNGNESFSDVEMLDLDAGCWIPTQSMLHKRLALAAVEHNGAIYAVGGFDGESYLKSVERLDPRENSWTTIASMNSRRSCHSLTVMNEKLYALGGYDGKEMVKSIEIYDPRIGSWTTGEPMNQQRGYAAAAVLKKSLYIIGGVESGDSITETVECYKEGQGWQLMNLKAIGLRCFASAIVL
ncbi:DCD domain-containing protein [Heracleum sosnowskyi]|uniref:DCD domain-containing protein n=1 Tax=Heracleum sosnowskyi TaxID=360622 RepID=A0AAD8J927_9APIA|nr:DCD domain-containing protein [Heracleum sosnowskyi]